MSDAVANGISLALLVRQGGGDLQGIAYWNYNVREQGLYNDTHDTAYDTETMFHTVSAVLPTLRRLMGSTPSRPEVLVLSPPARSHEQIGAERASVLLEAQPYGRLAILAKEGVNTAVVGALDGWDLDGVRAIVALSPSPAHLLPATGPSAPVPGSRRHGGYLAGGGRGAWGRGPGTAELAHDGLVEQRGTSTWRKRARGAIRG